MKHESCRKKKKKSDNEIKAVFLHSVLMKEIKELPCEIFNVENVGIKCLISLYWDGVYLFIFFSIFREEEKLIL